MIGPQLAQLKIRDFRSINREIDLNLDAPVVLIHGQNGAGKTSILSAIELALTGEISSLQKVDSNYRSQLLHYGAATGSVSLTMRDANAMVKEMTTTLSAGNISSTGSLDATLSQFFSERCYLAQSTLSQLLTIYQQSGTSMDSPLSKFVNELLGLDRLDALELGLHASEDLRHTKKIVPSYVTIEKEIDRFSRESANLDSTLRIANDNERKSNENFLAVVTRLAQLGVSIDAANATQETFSTSDERAMQSTALTLQGQVSAIAVNYQASANFDNSPSDTDLASEFSTSQQTVDGWLQSYGAEILDLFQKSAELSLGEQSFSLASLPVDLERLLQIWKSDRDRIDGVIADNGKSLVRKRAIEDELTAIETRQRNVASQSQSISGDSANLGLALSTILPHIHGENCPVCSRDFAEFSEQSLSEYVSVRIRSLSDAAERLVQLAKDQAENSRKALDLQNELNSLNIRLLSVEAENALQTRSGKVLALINSGERLKAQATEGQNLFARNTNLRRALDERTANSSRQQATIEALQALEFPPYLNPSFSSTSLDEILKHRAAVLKEFLERIQIITQLKEDAYRLFSERSTNIDLARLARERANATSISLTRLEDARKAAEAKRKSFRQILTAVQSARQEVVSTVFNQQLNNVWRDLFVRLAPNETFVPSFFLPTESAKKGSTPDLRTLHRSGRTGGAPGAMLSAGNLNTAALTLFLALHLSVAPKLPWLLLDDPVQSMDDVHISQFASLLRTLSKEQGRQVFVAVHERALFDYLSLELSPAFENDKLVTVELGRSSAGETRFKCSQHHYKPSSVIQTIAA